MSGFSSPDKRISGRQGPVSAQERQEYLAGQAALAARTAAQH